MVKAQTLGSDIKLLFSRDETKITPEFKTTQTVINWNLTTKIKI